MQYSKALRRPGCTAIIAMVIILVLVYLLFGRNLYLGGAPQAVTDMAMDQLVDTCINDYGDDCRDFQIVRAQEKSVSEIDRSNGVEAAWCVELRFDTRGAYYWDTRHLFIGVARINGELTALKSGNLAPNSSTKAWDASRERLWNACPGQ